ncbi:MAG: class I SAM-dependent methyltransferase [Novosphingobium sp.]|nr:MAG: class I SAM-dependent methyltransferase [Novosphingobium sp.]
MSAPAAGRDGTVASRLAHPQDEAPSGTVVDVDGAAVAVPVPSTHLHIYNVLSTLMAEGRLTPGGSLGRPLRILDIGCGDGSLIVNLTALAAADPACPAIEVHGFDVGEQGFRRDELIDATVRALSLRHPAIDWSRRIRLFSERAAWDYPEGYFDAAVSNQVLEHVTDLEGLLANIATCVRTGGISVHLFPMAHCIQEAHCRIPFAHWFGNFDHRVSWITLLSRLGIGRYARDRLVLGHGDVRDHARKTAAYIQCWTAYRTFNEIARLCRGRGLALSYHFTKDLFFTKARHLTGLRSPRMYRRWNWIGLEWLSFMLLRHLSSATLVIAPVRYDIGARIAAEKASLRPSSGSAT